MSAYGPMPSMRSADPRPLVLVVEDDLPNRALRGAGPLDRYHRRVILDPALAQRSICHLETTGRVSGQPRVIEIWFAADPDRPRIYLLAGGRGRAHWVRNIRHDPRVQLRIDGRRFAGVASDIEGGPDDDLARRLLLEKYEDQDEPGSLESWARGSLPVAIDLDPSVED